MWSCAKHQKHLNAYLDGELPERTRRKVERHLAHCSSCRLELDGLSGLAPLLGNDEVPPVPADLSDRVMACARTRAVRAHEGPIVWNPLEWWKMASAPLRVAACTAVLLAFFLGVALGQSVFFFGSNQTTMAEAAESIEGFEWFSPTPPASLGSTYLMLASNDAGDGNQ